MFRWSRLGFATASFFILSFEKDTFVACGVIFTAVIGLLNFGYILRNNRRASYVASVTAKRLAWISEVRDHLSSYIALSHEYVMTPPADSEELRKVFAQIVQHRTLLRLQLAPAARSSPVLARLASYDEWFEKNIDEVFAVVQSADTARLATQLELLVDVGQRFLWAEWLKVKAEAIHGDPYDKLWRKVKRLIESGG